MEIFKVAGSVYEVPKLDTKPVETRTVEHTNLEQNVAKEKDSNTLSEKDTKELVDKLNEQMGVLNTSIRFGYNDKINSMFVNILEAKSGKVIRKIPTEEVMSLSEHLKELVGVIFDKKS